MLSADVAAAAAAQRGPISHINQQQIPGKDMTLE